MKKLATVCIVLIAIACNSNSSNPSKNNGGVKSDDLNKKTQPTAVTETKVASVGFGKDTLLVNKPCVVAHNATDAETKKLEKEGGENFGEALADNLFYMDEAKTNAKKLNIAVVETDAKCIAFQKANGEFIYKTRGKDFSSWGIIAFNGKDVPTKVDIVMSNDNLKKLFKN